MTDPWFGAAAQDDKIKPMLAELASRLKPEQRAQGEAMALDLKHKSDSASDGAAEGAAD